MLVSSKHLNLIDYINKGLELKAPSISLHPIKGKNQDWDLEKTKKAFLKLADEFIESCKNENQLPIYSFTNPLNRYLDNKPPAKFKCSPGKNYFRVLANGTILACRMKEQPEDNIGTVFDKYIDIQRLIELRRYNYIEIDECKECEAKEICNLDLCPNRIFNLKNNIIKFPDTECIWTRAKHAGVNKIIRDFSQNQEFLKKAI